MGRQTNWFKGLAVTSILVLGGTAIYQDHVVSQRDDQIEQLRVDLRKGADDYNALDAQLTDVSEQLILREDEFKKYKESSTIKVQELEASVKKMEADRQELIKKHQQEVNRLNNVGTSTTPVAKAVVANAPGSGGWTVTHYNAYEASTGKGPGHPDFGKTASGRMVQDGVTIAVDPSVIPLGTWVMLTFPDGTQMKRRADDTGGAIKGKKIDLYVNVSDKRLYELGKIRDVKVQILK